MELNHWQGKKAKFYSKQKHRSSDKTLTAETEYTDYTLIPHGVVSTIAISHLKKIKTEERRESKRENTAEKIQVKPRQEHAVVNISSFPLSTYHISVLNKDLSPLPLDLKLLS